MWKNENIFSLIINLGDISFLFQLWKSIRYCAKFCPNCGNSMDNSTPAVNTQQSMGGGLFGDLKKRRAWFKKENESCAHGEHKGIKRPEGCLYFMKGSQGTGAIWWLHGI